MEQSPLVLIIIGFLVMLVLALGAPLILGGFE